MSLIRDAAHYLFLLGFKYKYKNTKIVASYFSDKIKGFYSQDGQDAFVYSEFFSLFDDEQIPKVFVDIGCNHPVKFSNSFFFEKFLDFKCIAVDPLTTYASHWAEMRPKAKMHSVALGSVAGRMSLLTSGPENSNEKTHSIDMFSTLDPKSCKAATKDFIKLEVQVRRADELFEIEGLSEIGILSIDVEGFEMEVLKGIDYSKTSICIAIIENNTKSKFGSAELRNFMMDKGFDFYARLWGMDDIFVRKGLLARGV